MVPNALALLSLVLQNIYLIMPSSMYTMSQAIIFFVYFLASAWLIFKTSGAYLFKVSSSNILNFTIIVILIVGSLRVNQNIESIGSSLAKIIFIINLITYIVIYVYKSSNESQMNQRITIFLMAPIAYVVFNIILWILNIYGADNKPFRYAEFEYSSQLSNLLGYSLNRTLFPLSQGYNNFGIIAGLAITVSIAFIFRYRDYRWGPVFFFASMMSVVLSDSRFPFIVGLSAFFIYALLKKMKLTYFIVLLPFFSLIMPMILQYMQSLPIISSLSRGQNDFVTLNSRGLIWFYADREISRYPLDFTLGFGKYGQVTTKIVDEYGSLFGSYADVSSINLHNMVLQNVFDMGYIYVFILLLLIFCILKSSIYQRCISISAIIYILLIGNTEAVPTLITNEMLFYFLSIAFIVVQKRIIWEKLR